MVLIASPKPEVRKQWRKALLGIAPTHDVATRLALERSMAKLRPAVLLLDLGLPTLGGVAGMRAIQRLSLTTKIVLLTSTPGEEEGIAGLKMGARGYCHTDINAVLLRKAIEMVKKGEIWVGRMLIPHLLEELTSLTERRQKASPPNPESRLATLTPRQREIVHLIGGGASNKEIASRLNVTEATVKAHLTAIFRKVGLSDRLRLALLAAEHLPLSS